MSDSQADGVTGQDNWSSYWESEGAGGEVFVNARGEAHPEVAAWWREQFAGLGPAGSMIDIACGAGSVFGHLAAGHHYVLHGADIAAEALAMLSERVPGVTTTVCGADALPFADGQFDAVVSQFGIEYAGQPAFAEAGRVVARGGHLRVLCHYRDGYIDARNRRHLEQAAKIEPSNFIDLALALSEAAYTADTARQQAAAAAFRPAEQTLAAACRELPNGVHAHLYAGFRQLFERRADYFLKDVRQWLNDMRGEVERNVRRLEHMRAAASSEEDMQRICSGLEAQGLAAVRCEPFRVAAHDEPLAWALTAQRD